MAPSETAAPGGIATHYGWSADCAYSWDVPARHAGGVTDDPDRMAQLVEAELRAAPAGAEATVQRVVPASFAAIGRGVLARRTADGAVVWAEARS